MITSIKNSHSNLYKDLFEKASEVLSGYKRTQTFNENETYFYKDSGTKEFIELSLDGITKDEKIQQFSNALIQHNQLYISNGKSPADYNFSPSMGITTLEEYYNWLPEIKKDNDGNPTAFIKLPLDEPYFEINLNTRAISIPADFKKNGVAVQGDDLAEVVYFMVDRYFDAMDLNNTKIYIEWETPKGKNGEAVKSISEETLKIIDDENYPGKIIFGWAISDAITQNSGTLKFAVRFVQWSDDKKELVYNFNTLTAQVTIHPNLGLDLEHDKYEIDNSNYRLLERIEPSVVVGGAQASIPYFLKDLIVLDEGYDIAPNHTEGTYNLSVVATADDTGAVSYVWKRSEIGKEEWIEIPDSSATEMFALTEEELIDFNYILPANRIYHLDNGSGGHKTLERGLYNLKDPNTINEFKRIFPSLQENELPTIYENRSVLTVDKYGEYKAEARNRIFNSLTKANSKTVVFKTPEPIEMDNIDQTVDKHIIGTESAILEPCIIEAIGDLTYQWLRADEKEGEFEPASGIGATDSIFTASEPGWYKLEVTRVRNRAETSGESIEYRVTEMPVTPSPVDDMWSFIKIVGIEDLQNQTTALTFKWEPVLNSDGFNIDWYLSRELKNKADLKITTQSISDGSVTEISFNPTDPIWANIFEEAGEDIEGYYYAVISNKLNGVYSDYSNKPDIAGMFSVDA